MGLLKDLAHIAGNVVKVNAMWGDVRKIVIRDRGVDIERLPKEARAQIFERVKLEYLNGNMSAESIASIFTGNLPPG